MHATRQQLVREALLSRKARIALQRVKEARGKCSLHSMLMLAPHELEGNSAEYYPSGALRDNTGCYAGLSDNGASFKSGCARSLRGALLHTLRKEDAGTLAVGDKDAALESLGSYEYLIVRYGSDGSGELLRRRLKHAPNLPCEFVFSEPTEVYLHGYSFKFDDRGRVMTTKGGDDIPLFMSSTSKLGWFKVRPVVEPEEMRLALGKTKAVFMIGDGNPRSVGITDHSVLKGEPLLRRWHVVLSHCSLRKLLLTLRAMGKDHLITTGDVNEYRKAGCGLCESAMMKRRAFTLQTASLTDHTKPHIGKFWTWDQIALRVPAVQFGYTVGYLATCKASGKHFMTWTSGMTANDTIQCHNRLRAFVRPHHGEIEHLRGDSHPGHRSRQMADYFSGATGQPSMQRDLSPGYVHELVGSAEVAFMHTVPVANAYLMGAVDLGEGHMFKAVGTAVEAWDYQLTSKPGEKPSSANMRFYQREDWIDCPFHVFGSSCKALIHPEERSSKYELHARPAVYCGPALNSTATTSCAVWQGEHYYDVDVGCVNIDERATLARTQRDHHSHQPFGQTSAPKEIAPALDTWYNPATQVHPADAAAAVVDVAEADAHLPIAQPRVWIAGAEAPTVKFTVGVGAGVSRAGDLCGWHHHLSEGTHEYLPVDPAVGGYEHRADRPHVENGLIDLVRHQKCATVFLQLPCGAFSCSRLSDDGGPTPLFTVDHPDGVLGADGKVLPAAAAAMVLVHAGCNVARAALLAGKEFCSEHPIGHGTGSLLPVSGLESHSTMHDTAPFLALRAEFGLIEVITDLGASGHAHRKTTSLLVSKGMAKQLREKLGTQAVPTGWASTAAPLRGKDEQGNFRTKAEQQYSPLFCERWAKANLLSLAALDRGWGGQQSDRSELADDEANQPVVSMAASLTQPPSTNKTVQFADVLEDANAASLPQLGDDPNMTGFPIGEQVEVYWTADPKGWFEGTVTLNDGMHKYKSGNGTRISPEVQVHYDDGKYTHSLHNTQIRCKSSVLTVADVLDAREVEDAMTPNPVEKAYEWTKNSETIKLATEDGGFLLLDINIDLENGEVVNKSSLFVADANGKLKVAVELSSMDTLNARYWHAPKNEREYNRSPQRDLWRTAKELKWDQYMALNMFNWVPVSHIDRKAHEIYNTLWAYGIKLNTDLTFSKLNPRWCVKGGGMDRDMYKSHAETLRMSSYRIIAAIKAGYYKALCAALADCSNAFQSTRTDGEFKSENTPKFYCWPAPGFERRTPSGERMACEVNVYMQGRIDATRQFNSRLMSLLVEKGHMMRTLSDRQVCIYHHGPLVQSDASLSDILKAIKDAPDSKGQEQPVGYAIIGWHVDDGIILACDVTWELDQNKNRVVQFLLGTIQTLYATTLTGWHGNKFVGFTLTLNDERESVNIAAPDSVAQLSKELLGDSVRLSPKHALTKEFFELQPGEMPVEGDPERDTKLADMSKVRHALGVSIWLSNVYIEIMRGNGRLCSHMAIPPLPGALKCVKYQTMYLESHGKGITYCNK